MIRDCPNCGESLPARFRWGWRNRFRCPYCQAFLKRDTPLWAVGVVFPAIAAAWIGPLPLVDLGPYVYGAGVLVANTFAVTLAFYLVDRCLVVEVVDLRCLKCGYNLIGNTTGICPECGEPDNGAAP